MQTTEHAPFRISVDVPGAIVDRLLADSLPCTPFSVARHQDRTQNVFTHCISCPAHIYAATTLPNIRMHAMYSNACSASNQCQLHHRLLLHITKQYTRSTNANAINTELKAHSTQAKKAQQLQTPHAPYATRKNQLVT